MSTEELTREQLLEELAIAQAALVMIEKDEEASKRMYALESINQFGLCSDCEIYDSVREMTQEEWRAYLSGLLKEKS